MDDRSVSAWWIEDEGKSNEYGPDRVGWDTGVYLPVE